jgi:hypothetical protein
LPSLLTNAQSDPGKLDNQLTNYLVKVERVRQQLTGMLTDLDTDISNAPQKKGFPFLNLK